MPAPRAVASAFGMHQADAGSDAYARDFALSLLSQEQEALYEIEEAIKRIDLSTYGICEMTGKSIAHPRPMLRRGTIRFDCPMGISLLSLQTHAR